MFKKTKNKITHIFYFFFILKIFTTNSLTKADVTPLEIGVLACLSGACAEWGTATQRGLELATEDINKEGGILSRKIILRFEDTNEATNASQAVTAFKKLLSQGNINFFIGPSWTPAGLALAPVAGKMNNVLMISPSLGVAEFNESAPNLFNTMPHSETATKALAQLARDNGWNTVGIFSSQQPWENLQGKIFAEEFKRRGGKVLIILEPNPDIKDLRTESLRIQQTHSDGIFLSNLNQSAIAAKQLRSQGYKGEFYCALLDQTRIDEAKGALEGATSAQFPESSVEFVNKFVNKYQIKPMAAADTAYDSLIALKKAIEQSKSFETAKVAESLLKVQFEGASGEIKFDDKGGVIRNPVFVEVLKNEIVLIEQKNDR